MHLIALEHLFRHRVLQMLLRERRIGETVIRKLLGWRHSGFSLHNYVRCSQVPYDPFALCLGMPSQSWLKRRIQKIATGRTHKSTMLA